MAAVAAIAGVGLMVVCSSSLAAFMMMGGDDDDDKKKKVTGPTGPTGPSAAEIAAAAAAADPCTGLVDDSPASSIPAKCLQKIFKDEGCTEEGTRYPGDDYNGWWRKDDGGGNYANVKRDINAWATMQDADHLAGCGRAT